MLGSLFKEDVNKIFSNCLAFAFSKIRPPEYSICKPCKWTTFCQYCYLHYLRGITASQWTGEENCKWLSLSEINQWYQLIKTQNKNIQKD